MTIYSKRFYGPGKPSSTAATMLYTCPAGRTALVKEVVITNLSSTIPTLVRLFLDLVPGNTEWARFHVAAPASSLVVPCRLVLEEGQILSALRDHTTQDPRVTINGYEFAA